MEKISNKFYTGERSLFHSENLQLDNCEFGEGESPLKESRDIELANCKFGWKYPLWYGKNFTVSNCYFAETARAGVWYTENVAFKNVKIDAPKQLRRCRGVTLEKVDFNLAHETLWAGDGVKMNAVTAIEGDYFAMNSRNMEINGLTLHGNYSFDGAQNVTIRSSKIYSKDAFWNSKNVTVTDSFIEGEYLGWNAENLTLINCTVASHQGMCYIKNLVMKNCKVTNTDLAFEYSSVNATLTGKVDSVKNPASGKIEAEEIGELIMEKDKVDASATEIIAGGKRIN